MCKKWVHGKTSWLFEYQVKIDISLVFYEFGEDIRECTIGKPVAAFQVILGDLPIDAPMLQPYCIAPKKYLNRVLSVLPGLPPISLSLALSQSVKLIYIASKRTETESIGNYFIAQLQFLCVYLL